MSNVTLRLDDGARFLSRAWPQGASEFGAAQHQVLWHGFRTALQWPDLKLLQDFIDPLVVGKSINVGQEDGFYSGRRLRISEWARVEDQRRRTNYMAGHDSDGNPLPTLSPHMREVLVRQRARAARELQEPLPADSEAPGPTWPVGARFWFMLDMTDHENCAPYLNPEVTELFYDAPTFERFAARILDEIDKELPGLKPQTEKIRRDLQWWVAHDAKHVPGIDDSWDI